MKERIPDDTECANMADNQVVFRKMNKQLKMLIDELNEISSERGEPTHSFKKHDVYQFYCECSDEDCRMRIPLRFDTYEKAHERDDTFIIALGHEVSDIETVVSKTSKYCIVRKFVSPMQSNETLRETALHNAS